MKVDNAIKEYKVFLQKYLFPLLGMPEENNIEDCYNNDKDEIPNKLVFQDDKHLFFCNNKEVMFKVRCSRELDDDSINLSVNIIQSFFRVSKYKIDLKSTALNQNYYSDIHREANYKLAVQKGICNWIVGSNNNELEELFEILEKWSVQTYEGKKVTFGFVINPKAKSNFDNSYGKWCDFLKDDFSAVFSDCINSVIELDSSCDFCRYLSVTDDNHIESYNLNYKTPIRFSNVIQKFVVDKCVGVFLLNNGDIILSKYGEIKFVKRNLKWLNFSYDSFVNSFGGLLNDIQVEEDVLKDVFASMLDVSFSHVGGIIAVIDNISELLEPKNGKEPILNKCDYLLSEKYIEDCSEDSAQRSIRKRMLKRNVIGTLVNKKKFVEIDRKLRCELISLDGACILDKNGNVCACGAIIKNDSGSSGGGRGAAAKKLSQYGFAIKVSTDGYVELYINGKVVYSIK